MVEGVWSESEREAFIAFISDNPLAGDVIPVLASCARYAGSEMEWEKAEVRG